MGSIQEGTQPKKSKKVLVIVSIVIALVIIGALMPKRSDRAESTETATETTGPVAAKEVKNEVKSTADPAKVKELLKDFTQKTDDMEGITWFHHKFEPKYSDNNAVYYYVGKKNDQVWLRLVVRYSGEDWLFVNKLKIQTDKGVYDYTPDEFKRDNANGSVWEWADIQADKNLVSTIFELVNSKKATIRFIGSDYHKDKIVSDKEKQALKETFDLFYYSGGQVN